MFLAQICAGIKEMRQKGGQHTHCLTEHTDICMCYSEMGHLLFSLTNCLLNVNINWLMWAENANCSGKMLISPSSTCFAKCTEHTVTVLKCYTLYTVQSSASAHIHAHDKRQEKIGEHSEAVL